MSSSAEAPCESLCMHVVHAVCRAHKFTALVQWLRLCARCAVRATATLAAVHVKVYTAMS
jgi:hypothetical protein